ncbi:MAG: hypothetical protein JW996_05925 [Candidatus Cloacimonetes bacterium]|nr:hypothetical protein [Candidatus Cloacimonadota bacterium]
MKKTRKPIKILSVTLLIINFFLISGLAAEDLELIILNRDTLPGTKTQITFIWNELKDLNIEGINIYRKTGLTDEYPRSPINEVPITIMSDCDQINSIITRGSEEWQILANLPWHKPKLKDRSFEPIHPIRPAQFDPCILSTLDPSSDNWEQIQFLARRFQSISMVLGQSYSDTNVNSGTDYYYQFRAVANGSETILKSTKSIRAGFSIPLPAPANLQVTAGDSEVLITWDSVNNAFGYNVYRREAPHGSAVKINDAPVMAVITQNLEGDPIAATMGLVDYRRWDESGFPITHDVNGSPVIGPVNGINYQYQVEALDGLEQPGILSSFSTVVTPQDTTPPGLPGDLSVQAVGQTLRITWSKVIKDQFGRLELDGISGYNVYRSENQNSSIQTKINPALIAQPAGTEVQFTDNDPAIISYYGEKDFYYRIDCTDIHGNIGEKSSTASGFVPDIYPPDPPKYTDAEGFQEYIRVFWEINSEPDIYSYEIYRSLCHLGEWISPQEKERNNISSGDFVLIGEITHLEAVEIAAVYGKPYFDDYTVPAGSPLCYAYWLKSRDGSQNLSGSWPYPNSLEIPLLVCQRLRDETPPPPPIITAVQARDDAIYLEWIAAPSQDLGVFHIYRSLQEDSGYSWIGGLTVEEPPATPIELSEPFAPDSPCNCDVIPLVAHEGMNAGSFYDKKADPKTIYHYKVLSVDQNGNESKPEESIPYSSYTFKISGSATPIINKITSKSDSCGLLIEWSPAYNPASHLGYIVFRSSSENGIYRQISSLLTASEYNDETINKGPYYWYKVQSYDPDGRPSILSEPYKAKFE